jgi:hypothetical protein
LETKEDASNDTGMLAVAYPFDPAVSAPEVEYSDLLRVMSSPTSPLTMPRLISSKSIPHSAK